MWWSWILTIVGVTGLYLAGRKVWWAWFVGFGAQLIWIAYATATHQWGFYVSAAAYGWVYGKNGLAWMREHRSVFPDGSDSGRSAREWYEHSNVTVEQVSMHIDYEGAKATYSLVIAAESPSVDQVTAMQDLVRNPVPIIDRSRL